jgi:hypothetical protein
MLIVAAQLAYFMKACTAEHLIFYCKIYLKKNIRRSVSVLVFDAQNQKNLYAFSVWFFPDPNCWENIHTHTQIGRGFEIH